ncbi:MAG: aminodeoxychorismate/anthranilate synthase component II [Proteobacteria bacterium]|nr:aminodeoxychorismate/anthranilate synthase component II [Cystobacterineae bacterium]MCL2258511.1 aminodeoxychorismate/anthranilate synthase component II [Cystobacterineae bacterium]MCL2315260.1 aminodeoxychorismate/anthranilate synthase component II [Pseudomonadota bacterium]
MPKPHILFIDNFDSFTFNLVDALSLLGAEMDIYRNDIGAETALDIIDKKHSVLMVLSPGPGAPREAGCMVELIQKAAGRVPMLGVCLGHQAIAEALGGKVGGAGSIVHGKKSRVKHFGHPLFAGLSDIFEVGRYHSLAIQSLPETLEAIATDMEDEKLPMAIAHRFLPIYGLQFHPESILTTYGQNILNNVFDLALMASNTARK